MSMVDTLVVIIVLLLIVLIIWSKAMHQTMLETLSEIRAFMSGGKDE